MHGLPRITPALWLRQFVRQDAALIMSLNAEPSTRRWLPSHVYPTLDAAVAALDYLIGCYSNPGDPRVGPYVLAVEHRDSSRLIGHVGFSPLDGEIEVSYAISESARGRGYGTEALGHACEWVAGVFAVPSILAVTASANAGSRRVLERASFVYTQDDNMVFQGVQQQVSRYRWHSPFKGGGA